MRVLKFLEPHLQRDASQLKTEFDCFFSVQKVLAPFHQKLHVNMVNTNEEQAQEYGKVPDVDPKGNVSDVDPEKMDPKKMSFEFIMPLSTDGMVLWIGRKMITNDEIDEVIPLYIPFSCGVILRGDCYRGGSYGSKDNMFLTLTLVGKGIQWEEGLHFCQDQRVRNLDERFTSYVQPQDVMVLAKRPCHLVPENPLYHTTSQTYDKYWRNLIMDCLDTLYAVVLDNAFGREEVVNTYYQSRKVRNMFPAFFARYPDWLPGHYDRIASVPVGGEVDDKSEDSTATNELADESEEVSFQSHQYI